MARKRDLSSCLSVSLCLTICGLLDTGHTAGWLQYIDWHEKNYRELHPELTEEKYNALCIQEMISLGAVDPDQPGL